MGSISGTPIIATSSAGKKMRFINLTEKEEH
jgi:hypothetical protein